MFAPRIALIGASRRTGRHSLAAALEPLELRSLLSLVTSLADSGPGSLRQAILDATAGETIDFAPALANQTIDLTSGQLVVDTSVTITAPATGPITVSGSGMCRVFWVGAGVDVTMQGLVLTRGNGMSGLGDQNSDGYGGALYNNGGSVTLVSCLVTLNEANGERGGGIANAAGNLALLHSKVEANIARGDYNASGGGITNWQDATLTILGGEIRGNRALKKYSGSEYCYGGGIDNAGTMRMQGTVVADNVAEVADPIFPVWLSPWQYSDWSYAYGGGIYNGGRAQIVNTIITGNQALGSHGASSPGNQLEGGGSGYGGSGSSGGYALGGGLYNSTNGYYVDGRLETSWVQLVDSSVTNNLAQAGNGGHGGTGAGWYGNGGQGGAGGSAYGGGIAGNLIYAKNVTVEDNQAIPGVGGYGGSSPYGDGWNGANGSDGAMRNPDSDATLIPALAVEQTIINTGATQRSNITTIALRFDQPTNLPALIQAGDITSVARLQGPAGFLPLAATRYRYDTVSMTLTVDLTIDGFGGSQATMLPDGAYQLVVDTARLTAQGDAQNLLVDADAVLDGFMHVDFHRLLGDFNGDAIVSLLDRADLLARFGKRAGQSGYDLAYDLNADGVVSMADYVAWTRRIGQSVPVRRASAART